MANRKPRVSVVIPCRNEGNALSECVDSILQNDFPPQDLEILIVDGMSTDETRGIAESYTSKYPFIRILTNPRRITPAGLNIGIRNANGDYVIILGSHSRVHSNFLQQNLAAIEQNNVDCVGGLLKTIPSDDSKVSWAVAAAMSHPFGVGNSSFRIGVQEPKLVQTVPFGCYKKSVFASIGYFDEELIRDQDEEFNYRLSSSGGKILLDPSIISYYKPRDSLRKLWRMHYQYGLYKPLVAKKIGRIMGWRQLMPPLFVASVACSSVLAIVSPVGIWAGLIIWGSYSLADLVVSARAAWRNRKVNGWLLAATFPVMHVAYGLGYWNGLLRLLVPKRHANPQQDLPLSR